MPIYHPNRWSKRIDDAVAFAAAGTKAAARRIAAPGRMTFEHALRLTRDVLFCRRAADLAELAEGIAGYGHYAVALLPDGIGSLSRPEISLFAEQSGFATDVSPKPLKTLVTTFERLDAFAAPYGGDGRSTRLGMVRPSAERVVQRLHDGHGLSPGIAVCLRVHEHGGDHALFHTAFAGEKLTSALALLAMHIITGPKKPGLP